MPRLHLHPPPTKPCVYVCVVGANQDQECAPRWTHCTRTTAWPASAGWETAAELLALGRGRRRLRKLNGACRLKLCFALEEEEELVEEEVSRPSAPSARSPAAQTEEASDWLVRLNQSSQSVTSKHQVNT